MTGLLLQLLELLGKDVHRKLQLCLYNSLGIIAPDKKAARTKSMKTIV